MSKLPDSENIFADEDYWKHMGDLVDVLDWVLEEQLAGRRPNSIDVAKHFGITVDEANAIYDELDAAGEFD